MVHSSPKLLSVLRIHTSPSPAEVQPTALYSHLGQCCDEQVYLGRRDSRILSAIEAYHSPRDRLATCLVAVSESDRGRQEVPCIVAISCLCMGL